METFTNKQLREILPALEFLKLARNPRYHGSAYTYFLDGLAVASERYVTFCAPVQVPLWKLKHVWIKTVPMMKAIQAGFGIDGVEIIGTGDWSTGSHVIMGKRKVPCYVFDWQSANVELVDPVVYRLYGAELSTLFNRALQNIYQYRRDSSIRTLRMLREIRDMHVNLGDRVTMQSVELEPSPDNEGEYRHMKVSYSDGTWLIAPAIWREKAQPAAAAA